MSGEPNNANNVSPLAKYKLVFLGDQGVGEWDREANKERVKYYSIARSLPSVDVMLSMIYPLLPSESLHFCYSIASSLLQEKLQ